jgi:hypothetical protein
LKAAGDFPLPPLFVNFDRLEKESFLMTKWHVHGSACCGDLNVSVAEFWKLLSSMRCERCEKRFPLNRWIQVGNYERAIFVGPFLSFTVADTWMREQSRAHPRVDFYLMGDDEKADTMAEYAGIPVVTPESFAL